MVSNVTVTAASSEGGTDTDPGQGAQPSHALALGHIGEYLNEEPDEQGDQDQEDNDLKSDSPLPAAAPAARGASTGFLGDRVLTALAGDKGFGHGAPSKRLHQALQPGAAASIPILVHICYLIG